MPALAHESRGVHEGVVRFGRDLQLLTGLGFLEGVSHPLRPYSQAGEVALVVDLLDVDGDRLLHEDLLVLGVRIVLNVLLSFAQFEREIIGERIRDKIAAQRRKGKWAGGVPVLGYDVDRSNPSPKLVVNAEEAVQVRRIFSLYLECRSLLPVVKELARRGWCNKAWTTKKGAARGGRPFDKCSVYQLLTNPLYAGKIKHKMDVYDGEHEPLIDADVFGKVQTMLQKHGRGRGNHLINKYGALLKGLLHCRVSPTCARLPRRWCFSRLNRYLRIWAISTCQASTGSLWGGKAEPEPGQ